MLKLDLYATAASHFYPAVPHGALKRAPSDPNKSGVAVIVVNTVRRNIFDHLANFGGVGDEHRRNGEAGGRATTVTQLKVDVELNWNWIGDGVGGVVWLLVT